MKEILAVLRPGKDRETRLALEKVGVFTGTGRRVFGRGRQRGLRYGPSAEASAAISYLPKKLLYMVVSDGQCRAVVQTIIRVNQSGQFGDGKIFVSSVDDARRIRTGERGELAVR